MAQLAIIANVNARRNREWPLAARELRKAAPGATLYETHGDGDLRLAAKAIAAEAPRVLAIAGGDGTVTHTVTALAAEHLPLPAIALLGGGAFDSLAPLGGRGAAEDRLRRLSTAIHSGSELRTTERDTLRVTERDTLRVTERDTGRCGFRFGVGLPVRFIQAIYKTGNTGAWTSARLLVRAFGSSLSKGPFAKELYAPIDLRVRLDGEEWPRIPIYGLVSSSVAEAGLHLKPFRRATEQPGAFQTLGLTAGPRQFALELPRLLFGRPARRDRLIEGVGEKLELHSPRPLAFFLDGEIYDSRGSLTVSPGPRVRLVRA
ncbi:MAG TPA: diacylglycerol kinase family protein [Myxococcales bacterium]|jgi:diacylglycerol kinase family enzyme